MRSRLLTFMKMPPLLPPYVSCSSRHADHDVYIYDQPSALRDNGQVYIPRP